VIHYRRHMLPMLTLRGRQNWKGYWPPQIVARIKGKPSLLKYFELLYHKDCKIFLLVCLKVTFIQKGLMHMHLSFLQTDKPYYIPELEFWFFPIINGSNHVK
jgi:hypothetical protein